MELKKIITRSIQSFETIIKRNIVYIDKTKYLASMIESGDDTWFLARPRRFGKTLTVSTFESIFSGKKDLFKGLDIESKLDNELFAPRPVIRLQMNAISTSQDAAYALETLRNYILMCADYLEVKVSVYESPATMFQSLLVNCEKKYRKIYDAAPAVLIDEYDTPVTNLLHKPAEAEKLREHMRDFYMQLKVVAAANRVSFVFVTGITKFVKGGLYSAFNNPVDISYEPEYGAIVGFTHDEILSNLGEELEEAAKRQKISLASLITKMKNYYDGFCFDGVTEVYNPISALYFLSSKQFENFWYDTASPQQVMTFLAEHNITLEALNGVEVTKREIKHPNFDRQLQGSVYLFQLGYLTLQPGSTSDTFKLILPNAEIKQSIAISLLETWFSSKYQNVNQTFVNEILKRFAEALADKNPAGVIREFNIALSCVPFTIYSHAKRDEYFYSGLLSVLFYGIELDAHVQQPAKLGIPDFIITHNKQTWVIELKVCREGENDETKAKEALKQIIETEYAGSYHNPVLLGAAVNDKTRRIKRWLALGAKPEFSEQERETENSKEICSGANEALTNEDEEPGDHKS